MPVVAVFGSSSAEPGAPDYEDARRLGRLLAEAGVAVATGGYGGLMEAVSSGAHQAGGRVIGVTVPTVFPDRPAANPFVGEERRAESLTERIHQLTDLAEAAIALPGSIGTFTELMMAWNLAFVAPFSRGRPKPVIAVGELWSELVALLREKLETDGLVVCVPTIEDAVEVLRAQAG